MLKVLIGPMNMASQAYYLARGLREHGIDAMSMAYGRGVLGYQSDWFVDLPVHPYERVKKFRDVLVSALEQNFDIFHFFQRSLFLSIPPKNQDKLLGFEIPMLKAREKFVAYRFTGLEVIDREIELKNNPYTVYRHGFDGFFSEQFRREWLNFLRCYCDDFMVVDPVMRERFPEAKIVPRLLRVSDFEEIGIKPTRKPLIIHAPTNQLFKGSKFIIKALKELKAEGVDFELKLLSRVPFVEALEWYKRADLIVDQVHIGWHGVLAVECMALGKPVAVYLRDDLADVPGEIPVININLDTIKDVLRDAITNFDTRLRIAERSRSYVTRVHDESVVIPKLISVYRNMMESPRKMPTSMDDIEYYYLQRLEIERLHLKLRVLNKRLAKQNTRPLKRLQTFGVEAAKFGRSKIRNWFTPSAG